MGSIGVAQVLKPEYYPERGGDGSEELYEEEKAPVKKKISTLTDAGASFSGGFNKASGCSQFVSDTGTGNWRVRLMLTARPDAAPADVWIYAGRRCLMAAVPGFKGSCEVSATVHTDIVIDPADSRMRSEKLVLSLLAPSLLVSDVRISATDCATLHLIGDTAMAPSAAALPYDPLHTGAGFGQMLSYYMPDGIGIADHARAGITTARFLSEGHLDRVMKSAKPGDYVLLHFGWEDRLDLALAPTTGFRFNLTKMLDTLREKQVQPILATPLAENSWDGTIYDDELRPYEETVLRMGDCMRIPVLDLHTKTAPRLARLGHPRAGVLFDEGDPSRLNDCGAFLAAGIVATEIRRVLGWEDGYGILAEAVDKNAFSEKDPAARLFDGIRREAEAVRLSKSQGTSD